MARFHCERGAMMTLVLLLRWWQMTLLLRDDTIDNGDTSDDDDSTSENPLTPLKSDFGISRHLKTCTNSECLVTLSKSNNRATSILARGCNNSHWSAFVGGDIYRLIPASPLQPEGPCEMFNVVLVQILFVLYHLILVLPCPLLVFIFDQSYDDFQQQKETTPGKVTCHKLWEDDPLILQLDAAAEIDRSGKGKAVHWLGRVRSIVISKLTVFSAPAGWKYRKFYRVLRYKLDLPWSLR